MNRLSETHRELLRSLVKAVRDGTLPEEFFVQHLAYRSNVFVDRKLVEFPGLSKVGLDLLEDEGLVFQSRADNIFQSGVEIGPQDFSGRRVVRQCYITPKGFEAVDNNFNPTETTVVAHVPPEISESLARFRQENSDPTRLAFVMMQFGATAAHAKALDSIRNALEPHGMVALRADDKAYHEDLYYNILTYIYGVRFGIAVFERIESDDFNPNVSLEVGYMFGLRKSVCFLKDKTLKTLPTDLVGKLYRTFDPHDPDGTIPKQLYRWMDEKGFIVMSKA